MIKRSFVQNLRKNLEHYPQFIHVVIGTRQVGKTTGVLQLLDDYKEKERKYVSADGEILKSGSWLYDQWTEAYSDTNCELLVIDEIQKVENWTAVLKELWDKQKLSERKLKLIILGSSSIGISTGLNESMAGRFLIQKVFHWGAKESFDAFSLSLDDYLKYGGYPGSYALVANKTLWLNYIKNSIIDSVIGKDILSLANVKSPALFRQCFDLICSYPAQEVSYNKLLGQIQDKGNIDLVKYYLSLFEKAFLIKLLFKYSTKKLKTKTSSPKLLPLAPALFSQSKDALLSESDLGRAFELMIGSQLSKLPGNLYYWRERNLEVDFIYEYEGKLSAIEVKFGSKKRGSGLKAFSDKFKDVDTYLVTRENFLDVLKELG